MFINRDSRTETKILYLLYFLSVFSEISLGAGGCGAPSDDISIPRAVAYFRRCIDEYADVIATVSLPESPDSNGLI